MMTAMWNERRDQASKSGAIERRIESNGGSCFPPATADMRPQENRPIVTGVWVGRVAGRCARPPARSNRPQGGPAVHHSCPQSRERRFWAIACPFDEERLRER